MIDLHGPLTKMLANHKIRELYLYHVPVLKTCNNWSAVKEVGRIDFAGKHADYHGGLVSYGEKYYFVPDSRLQALSSFRPWKFKTKIGIVEESELKKTEFKNIL